MTFCSYFSPLPKVCLLESQLDGNLIASAFWQTGVRMKVRSCAKKTFLALLMFKQCNVQCVQRAYGESAFEELDAIFYIVLQPNIVFFKLTLTCH